MSGGRPLDAGPPAETAGAAAHETRWPLRAALCALGLMVLLPAVFRDWFADPFIRNDDYLFYFPYPELAYEKTLTEGRWLNHLWTLRGFSLGRHAHFALAMGLWCLSAALVAARLFREDVAPWRTVAFAFALAAMPQVAQQFLWANGSTPAYIVLLGSVALLSAASVRQTFIAMPVLTVLAMMTYPTLGLSILMIAVAFNARRMTLRQAGLLCGVFVASCVAGILVIYALNWLAHDHFGVALAGWREARRAEDLASLASNLGVLAFELPGARQLGIVGPVAMIGLIVLAWLMVLQDRPAWLRMMILSGALSLTLVTAQAVVFGVTLPSRAAGFLWTFAILTLALAAREAPSRRRSQWLTAIAVVAGLAGFAAWRGVYHPGFVAYQDFTRGIAERLDAAGPADLVLVAGDLEAHPETQVLNEFLGFEFRLEDLTGAQVRYCEAYRTAPDEGDVRSAHPVYRPVLRRGREAAALCAAHRARLRSIERPYPARDSVAQVAPGVLALRLGDAGGGE